jgi:hypothetical protein
MLEYKFYWNVQKLLYSNIILNLLLEQRVPNTIFVWKTCVLW